MLLRFLLPLANALFTLGALICMMLGRAAIRRKEVVSHRRFMLAAFIFSCGFMVTFATRIAMFGVSLKDFHDWTVIKALYLVLMVVHDAPAVVTVPLVITTLAFGYANNLSAHRELAKVAYGFWVYSSVTGLLLYILLIRERGDLNVFLK